MTTAAGRGNQRRHGAGYLAEIDRFGVPAMSLGGADTCVSPQKLHAVGHHPPEQRHAFLERLLERDPSVRQHFLHMSWRSEGPSGQKLSCCCGIFAAFADRETKGEATQKGRSEMAFPLNRLGGRFTRLSKLEFGILLPWVTPGNGQSVGLGSSMLSLDQPAAAD
jgi:hypothetical protein